jgi:trigger factor
MKEVTLNIETQYTDDHQAKLTVTIEQEILDKAKQRAARSISKRTKIPGFRPGKAPYHIVERSVGEGIIFEEALDILIKDLYPEIIKEAGINPYGPGQLENMPTMDPPTFEFIVPLDADVKLGDFHSIRIPYELEKITDADVDKAIDDIRERQAVLEPVERPAQEGDQVFIRLSGESKNGDEDASSTLVNDRPMPVVIDSEDKQSDGEWPFPGFSRILIGVAQGDEKTLSYSYPTDSEFESLQGKEAEFNIVVEEIKSRTLPNLDEDFVKLLGEYETVEDLRSDIYDSLEFQAKMEYENDYNEQIIKTVINDSEIKYPPQMLDDEVSVYIRQLESRLSQQNLDMETYLKTRQMDMDEFKEEINPLAEERLLRSLVIFEISRSDEIQITEDEIQTETMNQLNEIYRVLPPEEARKRVTDDFIQVITSNVTADLISNHTMEHLQKIAKGELEDESEEEDESEMSEPLETPEVDENDTDLAIEEIIQEHTEEDNTTEVEQPENQEEQG